MDDNTATVIAVVLGVILVLALVRGLYLIYQSLFRNTETGPGVARLEEETSQETGDDPSDQEPDDLDFSSDEEPDTPKPRSPGDESSAMTPG